jgi:predicted flap endonuclease-1-like 5' DNA nuclease
MIRSGGALVPDSPRFFGRGVVTPRPFIIVPPRIVSETTARVAAPRAASPPDELPPITAIKGIGERLAAELARRRIKTIADLAKVSPQRVAEVKGVSESQAAQFIAEAQKLLAKR